jgi:hypothetical protein
MLAAVAGQAGNLACMFLAWMKMRPAQEKVFEVQAD